MIPVISMSHMRAIAVFSLLSMLVAAQQDSVVVHEDVVYSEAAPQPRRNSLDLFVPKSKSPPPLIMFMHGGVWTGGNKERFRRFGRVFAANGYACALINTQMFPFVKPDTMVADCGRALGFLHRSAEQYGYDGDQLFVMGHSSGAHLVSWLALDDEQLKAATVPKKALRGAILLSGVYDVRCRHFTLDGVFGGDHDLRARATPWLYADKTDVPVFLAWGQKDLPGLSLCARILRDRLRGVGVPVVASEYLGRNHTDYVFGIGRPGDRLMPEVLRFVKDPKNAAAPIDELPGRVLMWVATCARERLVGDAIRTAMRPHGVEVVVHDLAVHTGGAVAMAFRDMVAKQQGERGPRSCYIGGIGVGGLATATAPLSTKADGLAGRIVVASPLGKKALAKLDPDHRDVDFRHLQQASLLSLYGDKDPRVQRQEAMNRAIRMLRAGQDVHPVELSNTSAEDALLGIRWDDDMLAPMLLAFLCP